ncbi:glycosyltransferase family 9 protein [Mucilaginibacter lutimaris]|uniref:Glycosyltransferase family 9 protein n=1 Tax=Mucilaginibacter lutimaris TaxID=931629 RepID=A0ABW2ZKX2_9SPHI
MNWLGCKNILCIRPDNMGDLIMTVPAFRALKDTFGAKITVLTSSMAKGIIKNIAEIDDHIIFDLPWVKTEAQSKTDEFYEVVAQIKARKFDAAVIFTVYSQNPLPTAMLAYLAGIPKILAYSRENPYQLLTNWVPDKEPYTQLKHQVTRDLELVAAVGATSKDHKLRLTVNEVCWQPVTDKLTGLGIDLNRPWLILHAGVSEEKRRYPVKEWVAAAMQLINEGHQVLFTGSASEKQLTDELERLTGAGSFSIAGMLNIEEFVCLIKHAPVIVSVNTGTVHIAAAVGTPVVVLYAQTNPQHTPWMAPHKVLEFSVPNHLRSKNQVIAYVNKTIYNTHVAVPAASKVMAAVNDLLNLPGSPAQLFPEIPGENRATATS